LHSGLEASQLLLAFAMGIVAYIGLLHLWFWGRGRGAGIHAWVAGWCAATLVFQAARFAQISTEVTATAVFSGRCQSAAGIVLAYTLAGFGAALEQRPWSRRRRVAWGALASLAALAALGSPLLLSGATDLRRDWFGHSFIGARGTPAMGLLLAVLVTVGVRLGGQTARAPLERGERRALVAALLAYAGAGLSSVLGAMRLVQVPMLAQYAPLALALGLSYPLVRRHRRLTTELERMVDERTRQLTESERRYRRLVDDAPIGVVACDLDGRISAINPHLQRLLGSPSERASREVNIFDSPQLRAAGVSAAFRDCIASGENVSGEFAYTTRWGRSVHLRAQIAAIRGHDGRVRGVQAVVEDESARVALERFLQRSRKMRAVGQLAAGIAHEINNPMAFVSSNLRMLREEWAAIASAIDKEGRDETIAERIADAEELISDSIDGVERTVEIVRSVKEFTHGEGGERSPTSLIDVLEESVRYAEGQRAAGIEIERVYADVPAIAASAQLRQVFLNLVVNALQAVGERGRIRLVTRREGDEVVARVEDDGCGIEDALRERIFEPFFTTKDAGQGTGLGLYFSYQIVRMHDGRIDVESEPGVGTAFEVRLPVADETSQSRGSASS